MDQEITIKIISLIFSSPITNNHPNHIHNISHIHHIHHINNSLNCLIIGLNNNMDPKHLSMYHLHFLMDSHHFMDYHLHMDLLMNLN